MSQCSRAIDRVARRRAPAGRRRTYRAGVEPLESRPLMADLIGASFSIAGGPSVTPGSVVGVDFVIANDSPFSVFPPYEVGFYLSRDRTIDPSDRRLDGGRFAPGMPPFFVTSVLRETLILPDASDPFWQGDGRYTLGMIVDDRDEVFEENEANNANRGDSIDRASFQVVGLTPLPDLALQGIASSEANPQAGATIVVSFDLVSSRSGTSGRAVPVVARLSRDPIPSDDDPIVGRVDLPAFAAAGSVRGQLAATLPAKSDPLYANTDGRVYLVLKADPENAIAESDEGNNQGRGIGLDTLPLEVNLIVFDPATLPISAHKPGTVLTGFLAAMGPWLSSTANDYRGYARTWRGVALAPAIGSLNQMGAQTKMLGKALAPLVKSGSAQAFTTTTTLDSAGLAMADRLILALLTNRLNDGSVTIQAAAKGGSVRTTASDPWKDPLGLKLLFQQYMNSKKAAAADAATRLGKTLAGLAVIAALAKEAAFVATFWPAVGLALAAGGALFAGYSLRQSGKAAAAGDKGTYQEITRISKSTTSEKVSITYDDNAPKHGAPLTPSSTTTESISKTIIDTRQKTIATEDQILQMFDQLKNAGNKSSPFQGTYTGRYSGDSQYSSTGKQSGTMSITFTNAPGAEILKGKGYIEKVTYNQSGREVMREKNPFAFTATAVGGSFTGDVAFKERSSTFSGSIVGKTMTGAFSFSNFVFNAKKM